MGDAQRKREREAWWYGLAGLLFLLLFLRTLITIR
jgi:hypothetical protein